MTGAGTGIGTGTGTGTHVSFSGVENFEILQSVHDYNKIK
jgi:hypothetical protein